MEMELEMEMELDPKLELGVGVWSSGRANAISISAVARGREGEEWRSKLINGCKLRFVFLLPRPRAVCLPLSAYKTNRNASRGTRRANKTVSSRKRDKNVNNCGPLYAYYTTCRILYPIPYTHIVAATTAIPMTMPIPIAIPKPIPMMARATSCSM